MTDHHSHEPLVFAPRRREVVLRWCFAALLVVMASGAVVAEGLQLLPAFVAPRS